MKILMIASEAFPLARTGGLGDVVGALSRALVEKGARVAVALPGYKAILEGRAHPVETSMRVVVPVGANMAGGLVLQTTIGAGVPVYLIRSDRYFLRNEIYGTPAGDFPDNAERFAFFCKASLELAERTGPWDIIHCHDWQTALAPVLKRLKRDFWPRLEAAKTLLTIHNMAFQGNFPETSWPLLNLDRSYFTPACLEFYGRVNWLKGGILLADALTTVSKKYAAEITQPEYGYGLDGVVRDRAANLYGILNGVDYREWDPQTDPNLRQNYDARDLSGKESCKQELRELYGLPPQPAVPLIGMVARLAEQKGLDIIAAAMDELMALDLQMVVLGTGEQRYHERLLKLAAQYPTKLGVKIGFQNSLAHKVEAGADMFLMPSKYEPCGLNQIYSLAYGTVPIVRATGGLEDTIQDYDPETQTGNGFKFSAYSAAALLDAVKRALSVYAQKQVWRRLIAAAMASNFSWDKSSAEYLALYQKLLSIPARKAG